MSGTSRFVIRKAKLLNLGQSFVRGQSSNRHNEQGRSGAEPHHEWADFFDLTHDLVLLRGHVGLGSVEKQLIIFLHGEGAAVNQEYDKNTGEDSPRNQQSEH